MGGPKCTRADYLIELDKKVIATLGRYGEPLGKRVVGVKSGNVPLLTCVHTWTIKFGTDDKNCARPRPEPITKIGETDKTGNFPDTPPNRYSPMGSCLATSSQMPPYPPWSSVNNCTGC